MGESLHVIAGGGGAFLHGSRIAPDAGPAPRRLPGRSRAAGSGSGSPVLALARAGFLPAGSCALPLAVRRPPCGAAS